MDTQSADARQGGHPGGRHARPLASLAAREQILALHRAGSSLLTVAAALNSAGSRTGHGSRWTAVTVGRVVFDPACLTTGAIATPPADPVAAALQDRAARELRKAIAAGQLDVHYQPVVDLVTGAITSAEALVRWRHPTRGLMRPDEFIGLAERSGVILELTEAVVAEVVTQTQRWSAAGRPMRVAVNLSVLSLSDAACGARLLAVLSQHPRTLSAEITESVLADDRAVAVLRELAACGVDIAVDDFGTGYSSLAALRGLPVSTLKIDRSFLRDVEADQGSQAIVRMVVELAQTLQLDVIAEGIETTRTADLLAGLGVPKAQGYLWAEAMPAAELEAWLDARTPAVRTGEVPTADAAPGCAADHLVLFYDDDAELVRELTTYVTAALDGDGHSIVIATQDHVAALRAGLAPRSLVRAEREGRLQCLDAESVLGLFMRNGVPDPVLFDAHVGERVRGCLADGRVLAAYGEMVAVLWHAGNVVGALQLEELWNILQTELSFTLLCAYPLRTTQPGQGDGLAQICARHSTVQLHQTAPDAIGATAVTEVLLRGARSLLRIESAEQAVGVLLRAVGELGGTCLPADQAGPGALALDLSLGQSDVLVPVAAPGTGVRRILQDHLPALIDDARTAALTVRSLRHLAQQADTDPMTGLGNRRGLDRVRPLAAGDCVALLDLDHLRQINDADGHDVGDRVLVSFSRVLRQHLRASDQAFRIGGEEFLVILPATSAERALVLLERVRLAWRAQRPVAVTFSAGVSTVSAGSLASATLSADGALHAAKSGGRDRFELAGR